MFAVDTGAPFTFLNSRFLISLPDGYAVKIGPIELSPPNTMGLELPPFPISNENTFDSVIGADVIRQFTIGFDRGRNTVTLWAGGLSRERTKAWLLDGASPPTNVVELHTFAVPNDPRPYLYPPIGAIFPVMFDSGSVVSTAPAEEMVRGFHAIRAQRLMEADGLHDSMEGWTTQASLGGLGCGWQLVDKNLSRNLEYWTVGTSFFEGKRLVLDLRNGRLTSTTSPELIRERTWEEVGLRLCGSKFLLNTEVEGSKPRKYIDHEIVKIKGVKLSTLAAALRRGEQSANLALGKLYDATRKGCSAVVRGGAGLVTIRLKALERDVPKAEVGRPNMPAGPNGAKTAAPVVILPGGPEFELFPGLCVIPASWPLRNVPAEWIKPCASGHVLVAVPRKLG